MPATTLTAPTATPAATDAVLAVLRTRAARPTQAETTNAPDAATGDVTAELEAPAAPRKSSRKVTAEEATAMRKHADELLDSLTSGPSQATLDFVEKFAAERARAQQFGIFKLWSIGNRVGLQGQVIKRRAEVRNLFAGVTQWQSLGRVVRPEELDRQYSISGAPFYQKWSDPHPVSGERERITVPGRAAIIDVYDWSQTQAIDPDYVEPDWESPIAAGDHTTLRQLANAAPCPVTYADLSAGATHSTYDGKTITINNAMPVGNQVLALATQLAARQLDHPVTWPRPRLGDLAAADEIATRQGEAALVGWVVARALGLDADTDGAVTEVTRDYLHKWTVVGNEGELEERVGYKSRRRILKARIDSAFRAADAILAAYTAAEAVEG